MKKLPLTLIILSFLFAIAAVVIAVAGTVSLRNQAELIADEIDEELEELDEERAEQPDLPDEYQLNENTDPVTMTPEELGFTFLAPNEWGAFELAYQPGTFKGSGFYQGRFENVDIAYGATDPGFVPGREGFYADVLGYRETDEGFEGNFIDRAWNLLPERLVQGEIETENGHVLVVSADHEAHGPVLFFGEEGVRFAIVNTPGGPLTGGAFRAGVEVPRDDFRAFLESLTFTE